MNRYALVRSIVVFLCAVVLTTAYQRTKPEVIMADTANRLLDSLTEEQKGVALFEFGSEERLKWHYFPADGFREEFGHDRRGVTFKRMNYTQRLLAHSLLNAGLSQSGFVKAGKVMLLEEIVRIIEDDNTGHRDAENYNVTIFGTPGQVGTWGWRVEGHHLSLNYTIKDGQLISSAPTFFGGNPHEVPQGPHKGMRALEKEEDLGRALVKSLDPKQRRQAIFLDVAPFDLVTLAARRAVLEGEPQGLPASKMNKSQKEMLTALLEEYANNMPPEIAAKRMKVVRETPSEQLFFGWAGSIERTPPQLVVIGRSTDDNRAEKGNYYRVQSPSFLVEYDNTQNRSNHSHSVWRDFQGDFGLDVLALHYRLHDHGLLAAGQTNRQHRQYVVGSGGLPESRAFSASCHRCR